MAYTLEDFEQSLAALDLDLAGPVVVGVSGGPDSMALLWLLSKFAEKQKFQIHAVTVEHGLRPESPEEAARVHDWVQGWTHVTHMIAPWEGDKPETRLLEEARRARYDLLKKAATTHGASYIFIAHHQDDQAETFLIRLAKGSGLDGLSAMAGVHPVGDGLSLVRPLLDAPKDDLIALCRDNAVPFVEDPTNDNTDYLRPRLRAAKSVLEEEGLSAKRLAKTAARMARARAALENLSARLFKDALREQKEDGVLLDMVLLRTAPEELVLRVILHAMDTTHPGGDYGPRMERVESLLSRILHDEKFKGATLGGCLFAKDAKNGTLWIGREH